MRHQVIHTPADRREPQPVYSSTQKRPPARLGSAQDASDPRLALAAPGAVYSDIYAEESARGLAQDDCATGPGSH